MHRIRLITAVHIEHECTVGFRTYDPGCSSSHRVAEQVSMLCASSVKNLLLVLRTDPLMKTAGINRVYRGVLNYRCTGSPRHLSDRD
jgi:hypothetical protein